MKIRDRIKELRRVRASEILPNPKNWRTHPKAQQDALKTVLASIGFADAVLAYETTHGLMLVDGHLRAETAGDSLVPVLVLDINEQEADQLLLTLDPLSTLAGIDATNLASLMESVNIEGEAINKMLSNLSTQAGIYDGTWEGKEPTDIEEVKDFDPDNETYSIRVNKVTALDKQDVIASVERAMEPFGYKVEVF